MCGIIDSEKQEELCKVLRPANENGRLE